MVPPGNVCLRGMLCSLSLGDDLWRMLADMWQYIAHMDVSLTWPSLSIFMIERNQQVPRATLDRNLIVESSICGARTA